MDYGVDRERFTPMTNSMANVYVIAAVLAITLAMTRAEDDVTLLKRAQELFQPLPKDMATPESPITKERVDLGRMLFRHRSASNNGSTRAMPRPTSTLR
jgi:cytochrome c peroxidase